MIARALQVWGRRGREVTYSVIFDHCGAPIAFREGSRVKCREDASEDCSRRNLLVAARHGERRLTDPTPTLRPCAGEGSSCPQADLLYEAAALV